MHSRWRVANVVSFIVLHGETTTEECIGGLLVADHVGAPSPIDLWVLFPFLYAGPGYEGVNEM